MKNKADTYEEITRINVQVLELKLAVDAGLVDSLRHRERRNDDAIATAHLLSSASLLLEEAARRNLR